MNRSQPESNLMFLDLLMVIGLLIGTVVLSAICVMLVVHIFIAVIMIFDKITHIISRPRVYPYKDDIDWL